jgi:hypothetical protein
MKTWALCAVSLLAGGLVACSGDDGGSGSGGGGGDGGQSPSGSTASSSAGQGGAGEGGGAGQGGAGQGGSGQGGSPGETCDAEGLACGGTQAQPGCQGCAQQGACKPAVTACMVSAECVALNNCFGECSKKPQAEQPACFMKCRTDHPDGVAPHDALTKCIFCEQCVDSCPTQSASCMP